MKYLGIINSRDNLFSDRVESSFKCLFGQSPQLIQSSKLLIYYIDDSKNMALLQGKNSIILGNIYSRESCEKLGSKVLEIDLSEEDLNNRYYGGFIAFLLQNNSLTVFRDITGKVQFFYSLLDSGEIIFSNSLILLSQFINGQLKIDKSYLCSYLLRERIPYRRTFLENISELPAGCNLMVKDGKLKINLHWEPAKMQFNFTNKNDIAHLMQTVVSSSVQSFDRIVLNFSGGLDSTSILYSILSSMKDGQRIELINYYNEGFKSVNELDYARKISSALKVDLTEKIVDLSNFFKFPIIEGLRSLPNMPSPLLISWNHEKEMNSYIDKGDKHIVINGFGGDQIFMQSPSIYSLADAYLDHGHKMLSKVAMNLCQIKRQTCTNLYIKNIVGIIKKLILKNKYSDSSFFIPEWATNELIKESNKYQMHPLFYKSVNRPGKNDHIYSIYSAIEYANTVNTELADKLFYPFLQQPIIELALSIPSYDLFDDEFTRIPIRKSMHNYYKTDYVWRKDKGESTGVMLKTILNNAGFITSVCCDGFFATNKLIDKDKVAAHIQILSSGQAFNIWPIIQLFSTEIFLNTWKDYCPDMAYPSLQTKPCSSINY
jgi:asparagine synthase (glutamine-hydrolysing)